MAKDSLTHFVEYTTRDERGRPIKCHDWQKNHFIPRLSFKPKGLRYRFHAPPQYGKSIILSKRFPLWALVNNPLLRIVVVTYNEDFGKRFYDALSSGQIDVQRLFPGFRLTGGFDKGLSTTERLAIGDGTASIVFCTIATGFTGLGCDIVIIDDPYRGLEDAQSEAYSAMVESFFQNKLMPRINEETDIYLMYHAWRQGDIGDYAVDKYGFEPIRFPAIADGGENDPTGRKAGELLSEIRTESHLASLKEADPKMFAAMYQGVPVADGGKLFKPEYFEFINATDLPPLQWWYRGWDTASKAKESNDPTASVRFGIDRDRTIYITDAWWDWMEWGPLCNRFCKQCEIDGASTIQAIEDASSGIQLLQEMTDPITRPEMAGYTIKPVKVRGRDLKLRASPIAARAELRPIKVVRFGKHQELVNLLCKFDGLGLAIDDPVAALATAWEIAFREDGEEQSNELSSRITRQLGLSTSY